MPLKKISDKIPLNKNNRQILFWIITFLLFITLYHNFKNLETVKQIPYSEFKQKLKSKKITKVIIAPDLIKGEMQDGGADIKFKTLPLPDSKLIEDMEASGIKSFSGETDRSWVVSLLLNVGWIFLFIFLWWFLFLRQAQMGGKQAMGFGRSRAKEQDLTKQKVTFKDVAGCDETKEELSDIVDYLKTPKKYKQLGGVLPKGILLYGPPGTGKTLLARAVAGEAQVPFYTSSGSEFVEMFVGVGASRVRDLFEKAKKTAPAIIFVDELDAVGRRRFAGIGGGHDEREQTLNQLLVELDGFDGNENVILIGATNRPDVLDPALLRPGRFDRRINVPAPDIKGREEILQVHAKKIKLSPDINLGIIARRTPGFVGADLANIINESALFAARKNKKFVEMEDIEESIERVIAGPQRKTRIISEKERRVIAFHEAGHALVAKLLPHADPVHKISIAPRGPALGYTLQLPIEDKYLTTKSEIINRLSILLGGRAAEEIEFNEITTGAQDDLSKVTNYAQKMVLEFGMSEKIGLITLKKDDSEVFLGRDIAKQPGYSNETAKNVDDEIKRIVSECYAKAKEMLLDKRHLLNSLAERLLEKEVLGSDEIDMIVNGEAAPETA
ncbi:MAG: ATP-dependent zinc metalloprotease FtsH [Elusimicrobia bacterium]|nr:ATP-dependent zinc metalloprotease FtsH [Elusimicrobiota bacterium]